MIRKPLAATSILAIATSIGIPQSPTLGDSFRNDQWYLKSLGIARAHTVSKGSGVVVAIIDTGVFPHPDLRRNLLKGKSFLPGDDDGQTDRSGHGTNMASLVGSHGRGTDNGVLGIAPAAKILPVRISKSDKIAPSAEMGHGMEWALDQGADVINISASVGPAFEVEDAVAAALKANVVVVASVGNASQDAIIGYPAAIQGVLAVGATARNGKHARLSVKDPKVAICAPGVDVTTAEPPDKYADVSGTSPAAAIVSGAAALVRARFPRLSAEEVIHRLTATADDIGPPGRDDECGFGRLNVVKALTADVPPLEGAAGSAATSSASATPVGGTTSPATAFAPRGGSDKGSSAAIALGGLGGVAVALGVVAFLSLRRRRKF
jgi:type VII secretion-associated serine protease mycosin